VRTGHRPARRGHRRKSPRLGPFQALAPARRGHGRESPATVRSARCAAVTMGTDATGDRRPGPRRPGNCHRGHGRDAAWTHEDRAALRRVTESRPVRSRRPARTETPSGSRPQQERLSRSRSRHRARSHDEQVPFSRAISTVLATNKYRSHGQQVPFSRAISTVLAGRAAGAGEAADLNGRTSAAGRQTMPWAIMTSATRVKPAALAPST